MLGSYLVHFLTVHRLDQYVIGKFAESFELVPRTLAENAGLNAT